MKSTISSWLVFRVLFTPKAVFRELSGTRPDPHIVFFRYLIWLSVIPPIFSYVGAANFGWRLGADEPLYLESGSLILISIAYFFALLFGFVSTAVIAQWMAKTYNARESLGIHFALVVIVAAPLVVGSAIHLYPNAFINVLILIPTLMWCMYLLYSGLPVILKIDAERGMLMASALIAHLLVAAVILLGLTVGLWSRGIGPMIGV
jgi:hypothetical protein